MKIARFAIGDTVSYGIVDGVGTDSDPLDQSEGQVRPIKSVPFAEFEPTETTFALSDVRLLAPILPSKIIGVGKNYLAHADEMSSYLPDEPLIFFKPNTSVIGPGQQIKLPAQSQRVDFEGELAVVIGTMCRKIDALDASRVILGYACANDVTARDLQSRDGQWARAKGFDTFCPLGPWIETTADPAELGISTTVNGEIRQDANTSDLVFGVAEIVSYVSSVMTLLPGDVILTGTPAGIGPLGDGDQVRVAIDGVGALTNEVVLDD